jgi:hypothetical protein
MAEVAISGNLLADILQMILELRPPSGRINSGTPQRRFRLAPKAKWGQDAQEIGRFPGNAGTIAYNSR